MAIVSWKTLVMTNYTAWVNRIATEMRVQIGHHGNNDQIWHNTVNRTRHIVALKGNKPLVRGIRFISMLIHLFFPDLMSLFLKLNMFFPPNIKTFASKSEKPD